jgi:hypothetical protein
LRVSEESFVFFSFPVVCRQFETLLMFFKLEGYVQMTFLTPPPPPPQQVLQCCYGGITAQDHIINATLFWKNVKLGCFEHRDYVEEFNK